MFKFKDKVIIENCTVGVDKFPVPKQPAYVALIWESSGQETTYCCRPINWTHRQIIEWGLVNARVSKNQIRWWNGREALHENRIYDLSLSQPILGPDFFDELKELDFFGELNLLPALPKPRVIKRRK